MYKNIKTKNKNKMLLIMLIVAILLVFKTDNVNAIITTNLPLSTTSNEFPASYQPYINELKRLHPNWIFKAIYTNLDWAETIRHETYELAIQSSEGRSTVHEVLGAEWKKAGINNYMDGPYVTASVQGVKYVMDPRNFLTDSRIFQFETLSYSDSITINAIEKALGSSKMNNPYYKNRYMDAGTEVVMSNTYAEIIKEAGRKYNVSPIHIATRIIQETSGNILDNASINGSRSTYGNNVYNFCNYGSTPEPDGTGAIDNGLDYARSKGWINPTKSIEGFTDLLKEKYIKYGQDTIYFQKFDVNNPYGNATSLYQYQYMTNIMAPTNESMKSYNAYKDVAVDMLDETFEFHIPIYNNMPEITNILFNGSLNSKGSTITKINPGTKAVTMKNNIINLPNLIKVTTELTNVSGQILGDTENVGTGSKINVKDSSGKILNTYDIIIYGDISGDGIIDSADLLIMRQHMLNIKTLNSTYISAGNVSKTDNLIDSTDLLILRQHMLNIKMIEQ